MYARTSGPSGPIRGKTGTDLHGCVDQYGCGSGHQVVLSRRQVVPSRRVSVAQDREGAIPYHRDTVLGPEVVSRTLSWDHFQTASGPSVFPGQKWFTWLRDHWDHLHGNRWPYRNARECVMVRRRSSVPTGAGPGAGAVRTGPVSRSGAGRPWWPAGPGHAGPGGACAR